MNNVKFTIDEKIVVSTLAIGSFLEYFDFFLFIHFAGTLNKLFFAQNDAKTAAILTSIAYCTSYVLRPIGAIFFGYLGDKYGRKTTINITLVLMGITCLGMFFLPTYEEIGPLASITITLFRVLQSFTSVGEIVGAHVYLLEYLKGKKIFIGIALLSIGTYLGGQLALNCVNFALSGAINWRYMFLLGLLIFVVGNFSRRNLRETPDFIAAKALKNLVVGKVDKLSFFYACVLSVMQPLTWFTICIGLAQILRTKYGFSEAEIVKNNTIVFWWGFLDILIIVWLTKFVYPLTIVKIRNIVINITYLLTPFIVYYNTSAIQITILQSIIAVFGLGDSIISPFLYKNLPIFNRFKLATVIFSIPRAFMALLTSFGIILVQPYLKHYTYVFFALPWTILAFMAIRHFEKKDKENHEGYIKYYE